MNVLIYSIVFGLFIAVFIIHFINKVIKIKKMPEEEKREIIYTYIYKFLKEELNSEIGEKTVDIIEEYCINNFSNEYKIILKMSNYHTLHSIIHEVIEDVKSGK